MSGTHTDLNRARLPIPPYLHVLFSAPQNNTLENLPMQVIYAKILLLSD